MAESMRKRTTTKTKETTVQENTTQKKEVVKKEVVKSYNPGDEINCFSITAGELIMIGRKTGNVYRWANYGDVTQVEYQDLKAEPLNSKSAYIYNPLFVIDNEELLATKDFANVAEVYKDILTIEDIDDIFSLDTISFRKMLQNLPKGFIETVKNVAVTKIQNGSLDSINKIRAIDEITGTDLFNAYLDK